MSLYQGQTLCDICCTQVQIDRHRPYWSVIKEADVCPFCMVVVGRALGAGLIEDIDRKLKEEGWSSLYTFYLGQDGYDDISMPTPYERNER